LEAHGKPFARIQLFRGGMHDRACFSYAKS
jgi:hypothetical protein